MTIPESTEVWQRILEPRFASLLEALTASEVAVAPALLERLRRSFSKEEVAVAVELVAARRRAKRKFPAPESMLCDVEGVAQSSGHLVAAHKAQRFRGGPVIEDLCCGIGGDTMALCGAGDEVIAVDRSPFRSVMAGHNSRATIVHGDVEGRSLDGKFVHLDPGRRRGGARLWRYADVEPGPAVIEPLLEAAAGGALKLGPGVDWADIESAESRECEVIGDGSGLQQAVVWVGELARAPGHRTATRLSGTRPALTYSAAPDDDLMVGDRDYRYLLVPDPALERARLVAPRLGDRDVFELAAGLGWLGADECLDDPWFEEFEVHARMSWRPKRIKEWLRAHDGGDVVVRSRARAVDTDREQRALRGEGTRRFTVFGLREGKRVVCYVTEAVGVPDSP